MQFYWYYFYYYLINIFIFIRRIIKQKVKKGAYIILSNHSHSHSQLQFNWIKWLPQSPSPTPSSLFCCHQNHNHNYSLSLLVVFPLSSSRSFSACPTWWWVPLHNLTMCRWWWTTTSRRRGFSTGSEERWWGLASSKSARGEGSSRTSRMRRSVGPVKPPSVTAETDSLGMYPTLCLFVSFFFFLNCTFGSIIVMVQF